MKTIVVDSSYLMYKSYFAYPNLTHEGKPVGAFFGFAKTVIELVRHYKPDQIVFACDTPKPTWRHKTMDGYKAGRAEIESDLVAQIPLIHNWSKKISQNYFAYEGWEADDVIFSICLDLLTNFKTISKVELKKQSSDIFDLFEDESATHIPSFPYRFDELKIEAKQRDNMIRIFSSDRDLYQLFSLDNLAFINSSKGDLSEFDRVNFKTKYELEPLQWLDYKALVGDGSDNLKGVEGIGPKTATAFLQQVGSLYAFFEKLGMDKLPFVRTAGATWTGSNLEEFLSNKKNEKLIEKLKNNYKAIVDTYILSALHPVPEAQFGLTGFDLTAGLPDLESSGFKSLITMVKKMEPVEEQEGLF
jgi:DNA polymerase I